MEFFSSLSLSLSLSAPISRDLPHFVCISRLSYEIANKFETKVYWMAGRFWWEQKAPWFNTINPFRFISFCSIQFHSVCDFYVARFLLEPYGFLSFTFLALSFLFHPSKILHFQHFFNFNCNEYSKTEIKVAFAFQNHKNTCKKTLLYEMWDLISHLCVNKWRKNIFLLYVNTQ